MSAYVFFILLLTAVVTNAAPYSSTTEEKVGVMFPFRNGRFFVGLIADTFWCGSGNVSRGSFELGPNYMVDDCCRAHHMCPIYLEPGEEKYGFRNDGKYTIVSCDCNEAFFECLDNVNTLASKTIEELYKMTEPFCIASRRRLLCQSSDNKNEKSCTGLGKGNRNRESNFPNSHKKNV